MGYDRRSRNSERGVDDENEIETIVLVTAGWFSSSYDPPDQTDIAGIGF